MKLLSTRVLIERAKQAVKNIAEITRVWDSRDLFASNSFAPSAFGMAAEARADLDHVSQEVVFEYPNAFRAWRDFGHQPTPDPEDSFSNKVKRAVSGLFTRAQSAFKSFKETCADTFANVRARISDAVHKKEVAKVAEVAPIVTHEAVAKAAPLEISEAKAKAVLAYLESIKSTKAGALLHESLKSRLKNGSASTAALIAELLHPNSQTLAQALASNAVAAPGAKVATSSYFGAQKTVVSGRAFSDLKTFWDDAQSAQAAKIAEQAAKAKAYDQEMGSFLREAKEAKAQLFADRLAHFASFEKPRARVNAIVAEFANNMDGKYAQYCQKALKKKGVSLSADAAVLRQPETLCQILSVIDPNNTLDVDAMLASIAPKQPTILRQGFAKAASVAGAFAIALSALTSSAPMVNHTVQTKIDTDQARAPAATQQIKVTGAQAVVDGVQAAPAPVVYTVKTGDTLTRIAKANHVSVAQIAVENNIHDISHIEAGWSLKIPAANLEVPKTFAMHDGHSQTVKPQIKVDVAVPAAVDAPAPAIEEAPTPAKVESIIADQCNTFAADANTIGKVSCDNATAEIQPGQSIVLHIRTPNGEFSQKINNGDVVVLPMKTALGRYFSSASFNKRFAAQQVANIPVYAPELAAPAV